MEAQHGSEERSDKAGVTFGEEVFVMEDSLNWPEP
jgi:hypothetical protein